MGAEGHGNQMDLPERRDFLPHFRDEVKAMDEIKETVHFTGPGNDRVVQSPFPVPEAGDVDGWAFAKGHVISAGFAERSILLLVFWVNVPFDDDLSMGGAIHIHDPGHRRLHGLSFESPCYGELVYSGRDFENGGNEDSRRNTDHRGDLHLFPLSSVLSIDV